MKRKNSGEFNFIHYCVILKIEQDARTGERFPLIARQIISVPPLSRLSTWIWPLQDIRALQGALRRDKLHICSMPRRLLYIAGILPFHLSLLIADSFLWSLLPLIFLGWGLCFLLLRLALVYFAPRICPLVDAMANEAYIILV